MPGEAFAVAGHPELVTAFYLAEAREALAVAGYPELMTAFFLAAAR
jgi:hypothetical protein